MRAMIPTLLDGFRAVHFPGNAPHPAGELTRVLAAFAEPAFLVSSRDACEHANPAAQKSYPVAPDWLATAINGRGAAQVRCIRLEAPGTPLPDLPDKEIAQKLDTPLSSVRTYVARLYTRIGVHNRVQLTRRLLGIL